MTKLRFDAILEDFLAIPKALLRCLRYYLADGGDVLKKLQQHIESKGYKKIIFVGHTYNYFASLIPYYYITKKLNPSKFYSANFEVADFLHHFHPNKYCNDVLFVFISESGESIQIKQSIEKLKQKNISSEQICGVSNNSESFLAKNSHFHFPMMSGSQQVIGSISYITTILILYIIARVFMKEDPISSKVEEEIRNLIFETKFYCTDWAFHLKSINDFLGVDYNNLYFISKGASLSTAYQGALNSKSYVRLFGQGFNIGLFLHGPFQLVDDSFRCILVIGDNTSIEDTVRLIELITKKMGSGKVVLINNSRELSSLGRANPNVWVFEHTTTNSFLAPIFEIFVIQFLLLDQALRRGVIE